MSAEPSWLEPIKSFSCICTNSIGTNCWLSLSGLGCKDGCTYLQGRTHVLAGKVASTSMENAVHCKDGCSALQGRMQCTAEAVAVHCGSGCSALRLRWVKQKNPSCGVLPSRQGHGGVSYIPRALPPVAQGSALQAPECMQGTGDVTHNSLILPIR